MPRALVDGPIPTNDRVAKALSDETARGVTCGVWWPVVVAWVSAFVFEPGARIINQLDLLRCSMSDVCCEMPLMRR